MKDNFKPGDVVQLKSGGPAMTISHQTGAGNWFCQWFLGEVLKEATFHPETLKPYEEETFKPFV